MFVLPYTLPEASPKRIICHWTGGRYMASALDREHYHFLVEVDGNIIKGDHSIQDNDSTSDRTYSGHTLRCNTKSIGLAVCCMSAATRTNPGKYPMTELQWIVMAMVAAELCVHYEIPVTPKTVLGHFEVERLLGIPQRGKWDPGFLPWNKSALPRKVGDRFRDLVSGLINIQP